MTNNQFDNAIASMPIIPALRGIQAREVDSVASTLIECGIKVVEVTVRTKNAVSSPLDQEAIKSLKIFLDSYHGPLYVIAGTVTQAADLPVLRDIGVEICLSPNLNISVISAARELEMAFIPGVETISEAMSGIAAGAYGVKLFPSFFYDADGSVNLYRSTGYVRYLSKFASCPIVMSGDVRPEHLPVSLIESGATALNVGASFYQPSIDLEELKSRSLKFVSAIKGSHHS